MSADWPSVRLKDVTIDVKAWDPSSVPEFTYVDITSIDNDLCEIIEPKRLPGSKAPSRARRPIESGDVLFSNVRTYLRNVAQVRDLEPPAVASTGFTLLRPIDVLDSRFLYHLARSDVFIRKVTPEQTGSHYPATSDRVVRSQEIPLPEVTQQREIARTIDLVELSRRSAATHLAAARGAIERLRRAVLVAACTGRLTEDWREANPHTETVAESLRVLRSTKRERKQREQKVDLELPAVPASYTLATIGDAAELLEYGTSSKCVPDSTAGIAVLRMGNIQEGSLDLDDLKYCPVDDEVRRLMLEDGDLLFNRTNSPELVGKSAVFHLDSPMSFASYLIRVRFDKSVAHPDFVNYWLNSAWGRAWAHLAKTDGVSQSNINGSKLALMPLPLPPIAEQQEIVRRANNLLARGEAMQDRISVASRRLDQSSQSVLAKAFRGELVPAETS